MRKQVAQLTYAMIYLERANTEMKLFIEKVLNHVFRTVDKKQNDINEAILSKKPNPDFHIKQNKDDAFGLYCHYLDFVKPVDL